MSRLTVGGTSRQRRCPRLTQLSPVVHNTADHCSATRCQWRINNQLGTMIMADKGKSDKGQKEPKKKAALTLKEKRKAKNEKKSGS